MLRTIQSNTSRRFGRRLLGLGSVIALGLSSMTLSGCNDAQSGLLLGAGIGALAGQAIGHDTEATLIGTAIGGGAGYILGNESDKARHERYHHSHGRYSY